MEVDVRLEARSIRGRQHSGMSYGAPPVGPPLLTRNTDERRYWMWGGAAPPETKASSWGIFTFSGPKPFQSLVGTKGQLEIVECFAPLHCTVCGSKKCAPISLLLRRRCLPPAVRSASSHPFVRFLWAERMAIGRRDLLAVVVLGEQGGRECEDVFFGRECERRLRVARKVAFFNSSAVSSPNAFASRFGCVCRQGLIERSSCASKYLASAVASDEALVLAPFTRCNSPRRTSSTAARPRRSRASRPSSPRRRPLPRRSSTARRKCVASPLANRRSASRRRSACSERRPQSQLPLPPPPRRRSPPQHLRRPLPRPRPLHRRPPGPPQSWARFRRALGFAVPTPPPGPPLRWPE